MLPIACYAYRLQTLRQKKRAIHPEIHMQALHAFI